MDGPPSLMHPFITQAAIKVGDKLTDSPEYYRILSASNGEAVYLSEFKGKNLCINTFLKSHVLMNQLQSTTGKAPVVLFFYPKAATPGCTKEACGFRDNYAAFTSAGVKVFGISGDAPEANAEFAKANNLPFQLLSDKDNILRKVFGIPNDFLGLLPGRQTYVIDKDSKVVLSFNSALDVEAHVRSALDTIKNL